MQGTLRGVEPSKGKRGTFIASTEVPSPRNWKWLQGSGGHAPLEQFLDCTLQISRNLIWSLDQNEFDTPGLSITLYYSYTSMQKTVVYC